MIKCVSVSWNVLFILIMKQVLIPLQVLQVLWYLSHGTCAAIAGISIFVICEDRIIITLMMINYIVYRAESTTICYYTYSNFVIKLMNEYLHTLGFYRMKRYQNTKERSYSCNTICFSLPVCSVCYKCLHFTNLWLNVFILTLHNIVCSLEHLSREMFYSRHAVCLFCYT